MVYFGLAEDPDAPPPSSRSPRAGRPDQLAALTDEVRRNTEAIAALRDQLDRIERRL